MTTQPHFYFHFSANSKVFFTSLCCIRFSLSPSTNTTFWSGLAPTATISVIRIFHRPQEGPPKHQIWVCVKFSSSRKTITRSTTRNVRGLQSMCTWGVTRWRRVSSFCGSTDGLSLSLSLSISLKNPFFILCVRLFLKLIYTQMNN